MKAAAASSLPMWGDFTPSEKKVLIAIRRRGACTREQLGLDLDWPASSVSREVSPLLESQVLFSDPPGARRRNALLSVAPGIAYAVGIEIGFGQVRATTVDFNGRPIALAKEYRPERRDATAFMQSILKIARELVLAPKYSPRIQGIGVGFADRSLWNPEQAFAPEKGKSLDQPVAKSISEALSLPVVSRSDAACAALGERRIGKLQGVENGLFLLYSEGVGLGIIAGNKVIFGDRNDSGELGHIPIDDDGDYCHCGNIGCLETVAGQWALLKKARALVRDGGHVTFRRAPAPSALQMTDLCAMAQGGDPLARNMLVRAGRALGRGLAISASLFDPSVIVLGGDLTAAETYQPMIAALRDSFQQLTAHRTPQPIRIEVSALAGESTVIGAAELVLMEQLV